MTEEKPIWSGGPSQVLNIPVFVVCGLLIWLVVPLFVILWRWLELKTLRYELTSERLRIRHGVMNKKLDELELYRVRDYKLEQPVWLRLFSLGNIILKTADVSNPDLTLRAIPNSEQVLDHIRTHVEACRVKKGVREVDIS